MHRLDLNDVYVPEDASYLILLIMKVNQRTLKNQNHRTEGPTNVMKDVRKDVRKGVRKDMKRDVRKEERNKESSKGELAALE